MPSWILFALLSALFAALVAIFGKVGLQGIDPTFGATLRAWVMGIFLLFVSFILGKLGKIEFQTLPPRIFIFILLSGIAGALSWLFYFFALKTGPASGVVALDRLSIIFVFLFATAFLAETFTWKAAMGALFILVGAILMIL